MNVSRNWLVAAAAGVLLAPVFVVPAHSSEVPIERDEFAGLSGSLLELNKLANDGAFSGGSGQVSNVTCTSSGNPATAVDLSCDGPTNPDNELSIAVDPENPDHLLAGSNDYQILFKGSTIVARVPTGFFTSFDGGKTWTDGQIPMGSGGGGGNGDPVAVFNAKFDSASMVQLNAGCGQAGPYCGHISVAVSNSADGGLTWGNPVTIAQGSGSLTPSASGIFMDKPWATVDNNPASPHFGRMYVTWTRFVSDQGAYIESPIYLAYSDDAGNSWTRGREISGSSSTLCTFQQAGAANECDEDQFSAPAVLPNGDVVVHFANGQNSAAWESAFEFENQIVTVRSSDGGRTFSNPVQVASLEDGAGTDYPINVDGRPTQTGYQFRTQTVQGMTVDPVNGNLYVAWTDNRNGSIDTGGVPVTHTDVFLAKSTDGGRSWSQTQQITATGADRWMPWVAARGGQVRIVYMEESGAGTYRIRLARSSNGGGTNSWSFSTLSTADSQANTSIWFRANATDCNICATFIGDYNGVVIDSLGRTHAAWTDMSRLAEIPGFRAGAPQDAYYARR